jgi:hypothetical protein
LVTVSWKNPEDMTDITYNIYKNNVLIVENYADTLYSETIDYEKVFQWCIETVCEYGNSDKKCVSNETCIVNIDEIEFNDMYLFFPNPANDRLTIKSQILPLPDTKIELLNITGSFISSHIFTDNEAHISLEGLPNGIYFVRIQTDGKTVINKIVKQ